MTSSVTKCTLTVLNRNRLNAGTSTQILLLTVPLACAHWIKVVKPEDHNHLINRMIPSGALIGG